MLSGHAHCGVRYDVALIFVCCVHSCCINCYGSGSDPASNPANPPKAPKSNIDTVKPLGDIGPAPAGLMKDSNSDSHSPRVQPAPASPLAWQAPQVDQAVNVPRHHHSCIPGPWPVSLCSMVRVRGRTSASTIARPAGCKCAHGVAISERSS